MSTAAQFLYAFCLPRLPRRRWDRGRCSETRNWLAGHRGVAQALTDAERAIAFRSLLTYICYGPALKSCGLRQVAKVGDVIRLPELDLVARPDRSAIRRILLATGLGAIFGFQSWGLAECGFAVSIPWYGLAWILLSNVFLGFSIGATAGSTCWWKRGFVLGLVFSIPSAFGARALGLRWAPYGVAAIIGGLVVGLVIALIADALFPGTRTPADQRFPCSTRPSDAGQEKFEACVGSATGQRLTEEKYCLEHLDAERAYRGDTDFGRTTEDRIVWGELLDLELQEIDEQIIRICQTAGDAFGRHQWKSDGGPKLSSK